MRQQQAQNRLKKPDSDWQAGKVDVLEPLPGHSSSDQVPMPEVVQADPPLHRGPAAIGSSSRPPDSSTPPGPGSPSRCSEPSSSLKIRLD
ncbi:hypothetical protein Nepgr_031767 [Nepenthes gracilis]|uniref:Uncharacterized protein n=1 Tax=Nepenthes gracilis TaxID=150966 RepID=A0AAD3Y7D4_NEPGR|nr:hypothetical protein Nepgr_031767 [Nepenthes gracilis]